MQRRILNIDHLARQIVTDLPLAGAIVSAQVRLPDGEINPSVARNLAIEAAEKSDATLLLLLDADAVLLQIPVSPAAAYSVTWTYRTTEAEMATDTIPFYNSPLNKAQWGGGCWFVLQRDCFKLRFCEELAGYYGQDIDFHHNVLAPAVGQGSHWTPKALHVWHPPIKHDEDRAEGNRILMAERFVKTYGSAAINRAEHLGPEFVGMVKAMRHLPRPVGVAW